MGRAALLCPLFRGRWPAPAGLEVMAACGGGLCRRGRQPFGLRVVVSPRGREAARVQKVQKVQRVQRVQRGRYRLRR